MRVTVYSPNKIKVGKSTRNPTFVMLTFVENKAEVQVHMNTNSLSKLVKKLKK